jgi:hypothetical protein
VEANSTGGQDSQRAVAPSDDDYDPFDIILTSALRSSNMHLPFRFSCRFVYAFVIVLMHATSCEPEVSGLRPYDSCSLTSSTVRCRPL